MEADKEPGPGQIRDSNKSMLMAALHQYSGGRWEAIDVGIAHDDPADLRAKVTQVRFPRHAHARTHTHTHTHEHTSTH